MRAEELSTNKYDSRPVDITVDLGTGSLTAPIISKNIICLIFESLFYVVTRIHKMHEIQDTCNIFY
jgi:hypothetical protein